ncbi:hypothetical protein DVH05_024720 [Phytophthora capsici]|nr:hypothetical protein DVH05_024720 [Phytophthora capsici]
MLKLFCAIMGTGIAFSVQVNKSQTVDRLKKKIKKESDGTIDAAWPELQLFLAKTDRGEWLDEADAAAVVADDLRLFTLMNSTLLVNNPKHFDPNFKPTEGQVQYSMKKQLVMEYECHDGKNENGDRMLLCMVMNIGLPSSVVIAAHIFRQEHVRLIDHFEQFADIDDVRNGLLLFKPIKSAFDDLDIAILVDKQDQFILKVFNPTIKKNLLVDSLDEVQWNALGGGSVPTDWRKSTSSVYAPNAPDFNLLTTFGELDGKPLQFPIGSILRPFRCCLYFQAQLARAKALYHGWVTQNFQLDDFSSEGIALEDKMKMLFNSIPESSS